MDNKSVTITGFDALLADIDDLGDMRRPIYAPIQDALSITVQSIEARAKENLTPDHIAWGQLRASIASEVRVTDDAIEGEAGTNLGSNNPEVKNYALAIEFGSDPHWVPLQPLIEWVEIKQIAKGVEAKRIAKAVQAKIKEKGTPAYPYFNPAIEDTLPEAERSLMEAFSEVINNWQRMT